MGTVGSNPTPSATSFEFGGDGDVGSERARFHRRLHLAWATVLPVCVAPVCVAAVAFGVLGTAAAAKASKADIGIQKQAVLRRSDLPAGWKSSPNRPSSPLPSLPACAGLRAANDALDPGATDSPEFWKADLTRVENAVIVMDSAKQAKGWIAPYREPDAATCLEAVVKGAFLQPSTGIQEVRVYVAPIDDTPRGADDAAGFEVEITATSAPTTQQPAETVVIIYDVLIARVGRALTNFTFMNPTDPLPEQSELVDAVIGRLQDAHV